MLGLIICSDSTDKKTDSVSTCTEPVTETQGQDDKRSDKASLEEPFSDEIELATKSATSNKEEEEDIDENEMSRIKEFLEETVSCHWYSQRLSQ